MRVGQLMLNIKTLVSDSYEELQDQAKTHTEDGWKVNSEILNIHFEIDGITRYIQIAYRMAK